MPIDPTIALSAGQPTNPLGANNQVPNYLADPSKLNALLQMSGQMAAGNVLRQSFDENGNLDPSKLATGLANDPRTAPYAFEALNKGLDAAGKQLQQQVTRREQGTSLIAPFLLDDEFNQNNPKYVQDELHKALAKGVDQGVIDGKTAVYFGSNLPMTRDPQTGQQVLDVNAVKKELGRALISILPKDSQQAAVAGKIFDFDVGDKKYFAKQFGDGSIRAVGEYKLGLPPAVGNTPQPAPPIGGVPQSAPGRVFAPNQGASSGNINSPGFGQPEQPPNLGTGRYQVDPGEVKSYSDKIIAAGKDPLSMRRIFDSIPADNTALRAAVIDQVKKGLIKTQQNAKQQ